MSAERGGDSSNRVLTVPNLLSVLRLAGVPLFLWLVVRELPDERSL